MNRLEAYIAIENKKSITLFEKCGFKKEGILNQYLLFEGKFHNAVILVLLKREY